MGTAQNGRGAIEHDSVTLRPGFDAMHQVCQLCESQDGFPILSSIDDDLRCIHQRHLGLCNVVSCQQFNRIFWRVELDEFLMFDDIGKEFFFEFKPSCLFRSCDLVFDGLFIMIENGLDASDEWMELSCLAKHAFPHGGGLLGFTSVVFGPFIKQFAERTDSADWAFGIVFENLLDFVMEAFTHLAKTIAVYRAHSRSEFDISVVFAAHESVRMGLAVFEADDGEFLRKHRCFSFCAIGLLL